MLALGAPYVEEAGSAGGQLRWQVCAHCNGQEGNGEGEAKGQQEQEGLTDFHRGVLCSRLERCWGRAKQ